MPTKVTRARSSLAHTWACPGCGHRLVVVIDDVGEEHTLDIDVVTWVISGRRDTADRAIVVRSGGYPEHGCEENTTEGLLR